MAVPFDNSIKTPSTNLSDHTGEGVIIDIGTGDGRYVYQSARRNPNKFYIGIDPNIRPLAKISERFIGNPPGAALLTFSSFSLRSKICRMN